MLVYTTSMVQVLPICCNGGSRRKETSFLSIEAERNLMEDVGIKASQGKIPTTKDLKTIIEKRIKKKVSDDYVWDLFKRHNWKKK